MPGVILSGMTNRDLPPTPQGPGLPGDWEEIKRRIMNGRIAQLLGAAKTEIPRMAQSGATSFHDTLTGQLPLINPQTGEINIGEMQQRGSDAANLIMMGSGLVAGIPAGLVAGAEKEVPGMVAAAGLARKAIKGAPKVPAADRLVSRADNGGPSLAGEFPEMATRYPETGPPDLMQSLPKKEVDAMKAFNKGLEKGDPNRVKIPKEVLIKRDASPADVPPEAAMKKMGIKQWLAKRLTPEAETFQAARARIMKEMDKKGYDEFFDVSKRTDVNPNDYVEGGRTLIDKQLGKKLKDPAAQAAMVAPHAEIAGSESARSRLQAAFDAGMKTKDKSGNWYFMKQLQDEFVKEYGPQQGKELFKQRFAKAMASTTGGANPTDNLLMAHFGNYLENLGQNPKMPAWQMPFPIGGRFAAGNMKQFAKHMGIDVGSVKNPKRFNFMNNFLGFKRATIDEQMSDLFQKGLKQPTNYAEFEKVINELAAKNGVDPRYFQEVAWAGGKGIEGKPMISHVNDAIERTSRLTGLSPQEVVRKGLVRAEMPLYQGGPSATVAGAAGAAGAVPLQVTDRAKQLHEKLVQSGQNPPPLEQFVNDYVKMYQGMGK